MVVLPLIVDTFYSKQGLVVIGTSVFLDDNPEHLPEYLERAAVLTLPSKRAVKTINVKITAVEHSPATTDRATKYFFALKAADVYLAHEIVGGSLQVPDPVHPGFLERLLSKLGF